MRVDMEPNDTERVAAAAKFKAIQSQSAALAATTPMQTAEDLACDGGKLCGLKPNSMMTLKAEAVQFIRIDTATDRIILSGFAGGARQEVAIGQGGDTCGRAFWNAVAYKAASAAMSGGQP